MHSQRMAGIAARKRKLLLHPHRIRCKLYNIYQTQCMLYLTDLAETVSTHVDVCREDQTPPITQVGVSRQQL